MKLVSKKVFSSFAVSNLKEAADFYQQTLGLKITTEKYMLHLHLSSEHEVMIYEKPDHVPAIFTVLNIVVADIKQAVKLLKGEGVKFESYDNDHIRTDEDNIMWSEMANIAWFKDPSGNIFSVIEG